MHHTTTTLLALAASASAGNVYVDNLCQGILYAFSFPGPVGNDGTFKGHQMNPMTCSAYSEPQFPHNNAIPPNNIAISYDGQMSSPMYFTYDQNDDGRLNYSFNVTDGNPIGINGFEVLTNGNNPPEEALVCPGSSSDCTNAYRKAYPNFIPGGTNPFKITNNGADLTVRLCDSDGAATLPAVCQTGTPQTSQGASFGRGWRA